MMLIIGMELIVYFYLKVKLKKKYLPCHGKQTIQHTFQYNSPKTDNETQNFFR